MDICTIETLTGEETFRNATAKFYVINCGNGKNEKHIGASSKDAATYGVARLSQNTQNAFSGLPASLGTWTTARYGVQSGVVLKVFAYLSRYGTPRHSGTIYLQVRPQAALRRVEFSLLAEQSRSVYEKAYILGNFDLLTEADTIKLRMLPRSGGMVRIVNPYEELKPFTQTVIQSEASPRPTKNTVLVTTTKKEAVIILDVAPRRIRLKRKQEKPGKSELDKESLSC